MRHVEVDYHYIREEIIRKEIVVVYVATADQFAGLLTNGLSSFRFTYLISKLPIRQRPISLRGCDNQTLIQVINPCHVIIQVINPHQ